MSTLPASIEQASIHAHCKTLRIPTIAAQYSRIAEQATRQGHSLTRYLEALLAAEVDERQQRRIAWRLSEARLPKIKTIEEFDFNAASISMTQIRTLTDGAYLERAEPVIFLGETGTGKTHLMTSLCVEACRQNKRVRFTTVAALINELVEASHNSQLSRALARWKKWDLIALDEMGYVPLAETGAELLFQVIADRAEKAAVIITTNLPFSEWSSVFPNTRLCKALLDRITDRAHILETGTESYRFRRTMERKKKT